MADSKELVKIAYDALSDKKAEDIRIIDIQEISVVADYFVIATANNANQIQAVMDSVEEALGRAGHHPRQIEGSRNSTWVLMDFGDIIVNIFSAEDRIFYDLERIWKDGKIVEFE
jgi:ribosome-associated protein